MYKERIYPDIENLENEDVYIGSWPINTSGITFCWINSWKRPAPSQREMFPTYHCVSFKNYNLPKDIHICERSFLGVGGIVLCAYQHSRNTVCPPKTANCPLLSILSFLLERECFTF